MVLSSLFGSLLFKEKINKIMVVALLMALVSTVMFVFKKITLGTVFSAKGLF